MLAATVLASGGQVSSALLTAPPASAAVTDIQINTAVQQILKDTNAARAAAGLKPLTLTTSMNSVAQTWTTKMAADKMMYHNPSYAKEIPQGYISAAENIATGASYTQVVAGWMNSPGHRANILTAEHTNIGIGYYVDSAGKTWYTQVFAGYPTVKAPPQVEALDTWYGLRTYCNGFKAYWSANGAQDYKVDLYQGTTLVNSFITTEPNTITDGLKENTTYTLKITARNSDYTGKIYSAPVRSTTFKTDAFVASDEPASAPLPVNNLQVTTTDSDLKGTIGIGAIWGVPSEYTGSLFYNVVTVKEAGKPDRVIKTNSDGLSISNLTENTTYTIEVKAMILGYDRREIRYTPAVSKTVKTPYSSDTVKVGIPTNVKVSNLKDTSMTASWTAPTGTVGKITKYSVLIMQGTKTVKSITTTQPSYTFTGLSAGVNYSVGVVAHATSPSGIEAYSAKAAMASFTTTTLSVAKVSAPTVTVSGIAYNRMTISWNKPAATGTITGYKVIVKKGTTTVKSYTVSSATTSQAITGLLRNTAYNVVVEAYVVSKDGKATGKATSPVKTVTTSR